MKKITSTIIGTLLCCFAWGQVFTAQPPIVLTQQSKAVNIGTATANGEYTLSATLTADSMCGLYVTKGIILCEFGANRMYFEYPNFYFVTQWDNHGELKDTVNTYELIDVICWSTLFNGKPHSFIVSKSASTKSLYIDSTLIASYGAPPQAAFTAPLWLSSDRIDYKFSGTIANFNYTPTVTTFKTRPMPVGKIDTLEYAKGYKLWSNDFTNVADPVDQYNTFPAANFNKKATNEYNSLIINMGYMAGYPYLPNEVVAQNAKTLSTQLALKFRCGFRVCANLNAFYSDVTKRQFSVDLAIMDTAKYYPAIPKDFGSAVSQTDAIPPLYPMPLQDVTATTPLIQLKPTRDIIYQQGVLFRDNLISRGISIGGLKHTENREVMGWMGGGLTGTGIFNTNYNYFLDSMRSIFPFLYTTGYDIYSMWFWNENGLKWPQVLGMANTNRGTISVYTEGQKYWNTKTGGNIRGSKFRDFSLAAEIASGNPISTPYVSGGWNANVEQNLQPSNFMGLLGIYIVEGAAFMYPAYFTIQSTGVQNPKGYCWIACAPALAQAPLSNPEYWDIVMNGTMVQGTTGVLGDYNIWARKVTIKTVAKKKGTKYIIATTNQKENIYDYVTSRKLQVPITIDGFYIPEEDFFTRPQTTYWFFDASKKIEAGVNPKHLTSSVYRGWFGWWKSAAALQD